MIKLAKPSIKYKKSYLSAVKEYKKDSYKYGAEIEVTAANFNNFLKRWSDREKGINIPKDRVPSTTRWLVDGSKFIGRVSIRHRLNKKLMMIGGHVGYAIRPSERKKGYGSKILKLGLKEAKILGLKKVLITCDKDNVGSRKIIEKNSGVLKGEVYQGKNLPLKLRYWIYLN